MNKKLSNINKLMSWMFFSLFLAGLGFQPLHAARPILVSACEAVLSVPGNYLLTEDLNCSGTAVTISSSDVNFNLVNFTIFGDGDGTGILVSGVSGVHIHSGTVDGFKSGIRLSSVTNSKINGMILSNHNRGVEIQGASSSNKVNGNTLSGNGIGILGGENTSFNVVNSNTLSSNNRGIEMEGNGHDIKGNTITGGNVGILVEEGSSFSIKGNEVTGAFSNGISINNLLDSSIKDNVTNDNGFVGIELDSSSGNTVKDNTALINGSVDLKDNDCPDNLWQDNTFGSFSGDCIN